MDDTPLTYSETLINPILHFKNNKEQSMTYESFSIDKSDKLQNELPIFSPKLFQDKKHKLMGKREVADFQNYLKMELFEEKMKEKCVFELTDSKKSKQSFDKFKEIEKDEIQTQSELSMAKKISLGSSNLRASKDSQDNLFQSHGLQQQVNFELFVFLGLESL